MSYWDSEFHLWTHTVTVTGDNPFAHGRLAMALLNPDLGMTETEREQFDSDEKRLEEIHRHHAEALKIFRGLVRQNPAAYLLDEAEVSQNLGNVDQFRNRVDEAREHYEDALSSYGQLALQNPSAYLQHVHYIAMASKDLAFLDRIENRPDEAGVHFDEALKLYRQLAQENPDLYLPDVATTAVQPGSSQPI